MRCWKAGALFTVGLWVAALTVMVVSGTARAEESPACETGWMGRVYQATKPAVVRIDRSDGALGTGFVFHSSRHVATALHVVELGRSVRVQFSNGRTIAAQVAATDSEHDLAILWLSEDSGITPLSLRTEVAPGEPVVAIGNPYGTLADMVDGFQGLLNFSLSQGIVSAKTDRYVQTDAMLSPGNSGGPMLTCDGRVVAVADRKVGGLGFGVSVVNLSHLEPELARPSLFLGSWSFRDFGLAFVLDQDATRWIGPGVTGSLVAYDRIALTLRVGFLVGVSGTGDGTVTSSSATRFFTEAGLGWRTLFFPFGRYHTYLTLGAGAALKSDHRSETRIRLDGASPPSIVGETQSSSAFAVTPLFYASVQVSFLRISYAFLPDFRDFGTVTHRASLGLPW
jgi:hypothetical protein